MDLIYVWFLAPRWFEGKRLSCVEVAVCNISEHVILVFANVYLTLMNYELLNVRNLVSDQSAISVHILDRLSI
ncbi:hypothetical protein VNO78_08179 [Psophocarpus tetragonolobus]|uniref:Uncharacterized protein n=1 Tax=Psophocarpus tetragonolobus TaxID=3891 RepID=A0AAN9XSD4_PSOTE